MPTKIQISHQKARSLVSALGWKQVKAGKKWPVGLRQWLTYNGNFYYLTE